MFKYNLWKIYFLQIKREFKKIWTHVHNKHQHQWVQELQD